MKRQRRRDIVLFMLPTVLIITVFLYFPVILNFVNSLFQWSAFSTQRRFVGAANYIKMFGDEVFRTAIFNNLVFMAVSVVFQIGLSLVMAAALEEKFMRRFQPFFRTVYFLPSLLMVTVTGIMFQIIYNPLIGLVNPLLELLGLDASGVDLLGSASSAIWAVVAVSQWQYIGYTLILFLVAMQNIPAQLYEAAELDGVGPVRKFFSITLPQIREMLMVNMIVTMTGSIKVFDEVWVMTGGGPGRATETLGSMLYRAGFRNDEMGYASAVAFFVFLVTSLIAIFQIKHYDLKTD
ncbi:putative ABC transporter permease protein YurN [Oscillospiraceae bacterium]|uniref:carbohydrate ABC transporter permease n=1 Tax=Allofournierella sp. TaxID=1940256 RepID=UPI0015B30CAD|nr:putative ABC transporter permease protein YurN [Oscillospiraceae bacterium]